MSYVIYGLDADLIFLALSTNSDRIFLLREANEINKTESKDVLNYVSIKIMRSCIHNTITEMLHKEGDNMINNIEHGIKLGGFSLNRTNVVSDFIFMCYFLGNDFLPHIPSLDIAHNGIEYLLNTYVEIIHEIILEKNELEYMIDSQTPSINNDFLQRFINKLGLKEEQILKDNYNTKKYRPRCDSADPYDQELFKIDNLQFKINDPVKLGSDNMESWRKRYYSHYWDVMPDELEEFSDKLVTNYMMGIKWVTMYYFDSCPSWTWFYPFDHPPFISDIAKYMNKCPDYSLNNIKFNLGKPIKPFMQLLAVLPPQSNYLIPNGLKKLMLDSRSQLCYAYPYEFTQDFINKNRYWMGIPNLPPLDLELLGRMYNKYKNELTKEEVNRNEYKDVYRDGIQWSMFSAI
jgi:5'-3' exonuclease